MLLSPLLGSEYDLLESNNGILPPSRKTTSYKLSEYSCTFCAQNNVYRFCALINLLLLDIVGEHS